MDGWIPGKRISRDEEAFTGHHNRHLNPGIKIWAGSSQKVSHHGASYIVHIGHICPGSHEDRAKLEKK